MSANDRFWQIVCASYTIKEYEDMIARCKTWIKVLTAGGTT